MARLPRLYLPGCAQHITQWVNNREACFYDEADYHWVEEGAGSRRYTERLKINDSDPIDSGATRPGQGIGRHRPFETKSPDRSFWDRF